MSSGVRQLLNEIVTWLGVFVFALAGFWWLDGNIDSFLSEAPQQAQEAHEQPEAEPTGEPRRHSRRDMAVRWRQAEQRRQREAEEQDDVGYGQVVLHAGRSGHYEVNARINNRSIDLMADTGATYVALSYESARRLGLTGNLRYTARTRTANGIAKAAPVILDSIQVGDIKLYDIQAFVSEPGRLSTNLLGMSFLGRLKIEMGRNRMVLSR